jgi:hypothetical protein
MSLLSHLVRATLAPEQAARPTLPQQFSNWGAGGGADDVRWGEETDATEAPAPRTGPIRDDPFAVRPRSAASESEPPESELPEPGPSAEMPRRTTRLRLPDFPKVDPDFPEVEAASSPRQARSNRAAEPMIEAGTAPAPGPRSARPQPEPRADQTPPPRRARRAAPTGLSAPEIAHAAAAAPAPRIADAVATAAEPLRAVVPEVGTPVDVPSRSARHDPSAPVRDEAMPSVPDLRRDPARLAEPRVAPITREAAPVSALQPAASLVAPVAARPAAAVPVLAVPQVILPEPAPERPQLPDVHISIGRVEVRAAAGAPPRPAPREASSKGEPLSLDAYLNRRSGSTR